MTSSPLPLTVIISDSVLEIRSVVCEGLPVNLDDDGDRSHAEYGKR